MSRTTVLDAFGPYRRAWRARTVLPTALVLTDLGAEGLDLQGAQGVVHLDSPWHVVGLRQRTGRAARMGQLAPEVVDLHRRPPTAIADALGIVQLIRRKRTRTDRWLAALESRAPHPDQPRRQAPRFDEALIVRLRNGGRRGTIALAAARGRWRAVDLDLIAASGLRRMTCRQPLPDDLMDLVREITRPVHVSRPRLVARLMDAARRAARDRHDAELERLDWLVRASRRSHGTGLERALAGEITVEAFGRQLGTAPDLSDDVVGWIRFGSPGRSTD